MMGRKYYEHDLPELIKQLRRIGDALEKLATLEEQGVASSFSARGPHVHSSLSIHAFLLLPDRDATRRFIRHSSRRLVLNHSAAPVSNADSGDLFPGFR